jgi:CheY-like chemotaxis protein
MDHLPVCVLVVEDDEESSRLMCELFALRGYQAHHASTGASAIKLAEEHAPRLILMDIQLPDMDGTVVLSTLRDPRWSTRWRLSCRLTMISGYRFFTERDLNHATLTAWRGSTK